MPNDPLRYENEERLRKAIEELLGRYHAETLWAVEQGMFQSGNIPTSYWSSLRQDIRDTIAPHLFNLEHAAAIRMAESVGDPLTLAEIGRTTMDVVAETSERYARSLVEKIKHFVSESINEAEAAGVALAIVIAMMLDEKAMKRLAIKFTTNGITAAERSTANRIQSHLDAEYGQIERSPVQDDNTSQTTGFSSDTTGGLVLPESGLVKPRENETTTSQPTQPGSSGSIPWTGKKGQIKLVSIWRVQTKPDGTPDGKVCPVCFPLHGKPDFMWPKKYATGPQAHPNCRCYTDWEFWMDGKPIRSNN